MILPPGKTNSAKLKIATIRKGSVFYQISRSSHPSPIYYSKDQSGRFNSPKGEYGVCYMADSFEAAFAESLGHSVAEHFTPSHIKLMSESDLKTHNIYKIIAEDTLRVGELCGTGLPRLNIDNNINTSPKPYTVPQQWSLWVHQHPNLLDGIRYHSRHLPNVRNVALFERCSPNLSAVDLGRVIDWNDSKSGKDIWDILDDHGWGVV